MKSRNDHLKKVSAKLGVLSSAIRLLNRKDRARCLYVIAIYIFLGLFDILAVFTLGIVGSLSVTGVSGNRPGDRTFALLSALNLESKSIQTQVAILGGSAALILVLKSLVSLYLSKRTLLFLARRSAIISQRLISNLLSRPILGIKNRSIQNTIYSLTTGVEALMVVTIGGSLLLMADIFLIISFSASLFFVDIAVAMSSLILFSSVGVALFAFQQSKARKLGEKATLLQVSSAGKISDVVSCYRELLVKNRREYYADKIGQLRFEAAEAGARMGVMALLSKYIIEITMVVGGLAIGTIQFMTQSSSRAVAVISIFLVSSTRIAPAVLRIQTGLINIRNSFASSRTTISLVQEGNWDKEARFNQAQTIIDSNLAFDHEGFYPRIQVKDIKFNYPGKKSEAIDRLSLEINEGDFVAIVGRSGSGKTTLVDLLLGVHLPSSGSVLISGVSPQDAYTKWPGAVAYVPQDANMIDGTIKENVCLGFNQEVVPDETIEKLLSEVELSELLKLPLGIHSQVGDKGSKLSGGQRQRLGIARALFTNPRLMILDEATSSLDAATEIKITSLLSRKKGSLTMVVIAHRLSTVKDADELIYLDSGKVLGRGSFHDLRAKLADFDEQASLMGL